jgi:hypothetical protein
MLIKENVMSNTNLKLENFLEEYKGFLTAKQRTAILNGVELTTRLEHYARTALGITTEAETKKNTIIWSPPGAGKTFTVKNVAKAAGIDYIQYHGKASLNGFVMKMAKACYLQATTGINTTIPVWIDDCDVFFSDAASLNFMKIVLDNDDPAISWDVNVGNQITKAEKIGDTILSEALKYWDNGGVGIEIPLDNVRFTITTNKKLASKQDIGKRTINMHEHAVRDRCKWRAFNIDSDEAWGWMASVMLSDNVFQDDNFQLTPLQSLQLLQIFYTNWNNLSANSMRTVKEAGAMLFNNPDSFADEFEQNFLA